MLEISLTLTLMALGILPLMRWSRKLGETPLEEEEELLIKIRDEINSLAPQFGLPPIRLVCFLPGERYQAYFCVEGVERPFGLHWRAKDFNDEFWARQKVWCAYLKFIVNRHLIRERDPSLYIHMDDWASYIWYVEVGFPGTKTALELEFRGEWRDKSSLMLAAMNRALMVAQWVTLAEGKWDDLLPQFLHWYCIFQRSDPDELRRVAGLTFL
jgi:hypothetical protein